VRRKIDLVADANEHQANEETRQHHDGPEAAAARLHEEDGGNGADEEGPAADKRHVVCLFGVEADLVHEHRHVVHDCVDTRELAEEDHDVGVDQGATGAGNTVTVS